MIHYIVTYANSADARFDFEYYLQNHVPLGEKLLGDFGLINTEVERGLIDSAGKKPALLCVTRLYFASADSMHAGFAQHGARLKADIENYTNVDPVFTLAESLLKQT